MELLIKTSDNGVPGQTARDRRAYKQGMVVAAFPDGHTWGKEELNIKKFVIIRIPDAAWDPAWLVPEMSAVVALDNKPFITARRPKVIPLEEIFTTQELLDLKAEKTVSAAIREISDIKTKAQDYDYNSRPAEFGLDW